MGWQLAGRAMSHVLDQLEPFANGSRGDIAPEDAVFMMNRLKQVCTKHVLSFFLFLFLFSPFFFLFPV